MQRVNRNNPVAFQHLVARRYCAMLKRAQDRGKEFNLNLTSIRNLLRTKKCPYTGITLQIYHYPPGTSQSMIPRDSLSIERLDCDKGYVKGNVIAISHEANLARGDLSIQQIENMYKVMKRRKLL